MSKLELLEFSLLCLWVAVFIYATLMHKDVSTACSAAFGCFCASAAIKIAFKQ